jgi:hypothetical protein
MNSITVKLITIILIAHIRKKFEKKEINIVENISAKPIPGMFHCFIAGICLTTAEVKMILTKSKKDCESLSDYECHELFIGEIDNNVHLTLRTRRYLDSKYAELIKKHSSYPFSRWVNMVRYRVCPENAGAFIWISAAHYTLSDLEIHQVFEAFHMLLHTSLHALINFNWKMEFIRNGCTSAVEEILLLKKKIKELTFTLEQKTNLELMNELQCISNCDSVSSAGAQMQLLEQIENLNQCCEQFKEQRDAILSKNYALDEKLAKCNQEIRSQNSIIKQLKEELRDLLRNSSGECTNDTCPNFDLCGKRVLIVGGLSKINSMYRQIVTEHNGQFEYHDGYRCGYATSLQASIEHSDIILCPVDVNSHSACLTVKKHCKAAGKGFQMLRKSSLSSIKSALYREVS